MSRGGKSRLRTDCGVILSSSLHKARINAAGEAVEKEVQARKPSGEQLKKEHGR